MIPTLDWRDFARGTDRAGFVRNLGTACRGPGFFLLGHHGIDRAVTADVFAQAERLFELTEAEKRTLHVPSRPQDRGWTKIGTETLGTDAQSPDRREAFGIGPEAPGGAPQARWGTPYRGGNLWPDLPGFRDAMLRYFHAAQALSLALHRAVAAELCLPEDWFDGRFDQPEATLRLLRYPPASGANGEFGAAAHRDDGALTLLLTDGEPGLQVHAGDDAGWIDVPHRPGTIVVNVGDTLSDWSGGRYVSSPHRVLAPSRDRRAVAFFLRPGVTNPRKTAEKTVGNTASVTWGTGIAMHRARA